MTNNTNRAVEDNPGTNAANPRPQDKYGHIIELVERNGDIAATSFRWGIFMLGAGRRGDRTVVHR